jgi:hypothetical protein
MEEMNERLQVLEMIESGVISAGEGARLLRALEGDNTAQVRLTSKNEVGHPVEPISEAESAPDPISNEVSPAIPTQEFDASIERWRRWWTIPLWIGVGITAIGGLLMFWAYQSTGLSFWFGCAWLPFLIGLAVIVMAWGSRTARWLHVRVQQASSEWPRTIAFSFPLPIRLAAWFVRTFGRFIPQLDRAGLDEMILALGQTTSKENPFYVEVNEGDTGERVQVYIG